MQFNDAALARTIGGGGSQGAPTPANATGGRGNSSPWTQRSRGNRGGQGRQHGGNGGADRNQLHAEIAAKLPGMGKEAVIDITSCDADKIIRAFEEISNYIGSNIEDVGHQIQQAFISGEHHDWTATRPQDPHRLMVRVKAEDDSDGKMVPIDPKLVDEYDIISYETTVKNTQFVKSRQPQPLNMVQINYVGITTKY